MNRTLFPNRIITITDSFPQFEQHRQGSVQSPEDSPMPCFSEYRSTMPPERKSQSKNQFLVQFRLKSPQTSVFASSSHTEDTLQDVSIPFFEQPSLAVQEADHIFVYPPRHPPSHCSIRMAECRIPIPDVKKKQGKPCLL